MALRISAANQALSTTVGMPTGDLTILGWFTREVDQNDYTCVFRFVNGASQIAFEADGTTGDSFHLNTHGGSSAVFVPAIGTWYCFALTRIGTSHVLRYGTDPLAMTVQTAITAAVFTPTTLHLGQYSAAAEWLNGRLADIKQYSVGLSTDQIIQELVQYQPTTTDTLQRYHPFVNPEVTDYSGLGRNLATGGGTPTIDDGPPIRWGRSRGPRVGSSLAPPDVDAGVDASVVNRQPFSRTATETGGAVDTREWAILSGPADVGVVLDSDEVLLWTPTVPGDYVLRYTASNAAGSDFDDVAVTVVAVVVAMSGVATAVSSGTQTFRVATKLTKVVSARGVATGKTRVATKLAKTLTAHGVITAKLEVVTTVKRKATARGVLTGVLRASVKVKGSTAGNSLAEATISSARRLSALATGGSTGIGAVFRARLMDAAPVIGRGVVVKAQLAAPAGGIATAGSTATGNIIQIRVISGDASGNSVASAKIQVVTGLKRTITADSSVDALLAVVARYHNERANATSAIIGDAVKTIFVSGSATGGSYASADYMVGVTGMDGIAQAISVINNADAQVITGLRETVTAIGSLDADLYRAAVVKGRPVARGKVTFNKVLGRSRLMDAPRVVGKGTIAPATAQRTVVFHPQLEATSSIAPFNLRVITDFGPQYLVAESSVRERSVRIVVTTATAHGEVDRDRTRSVHVVSGFMLVQSSATGNLVWAPVRHKAQAKSYISGDLVALKLYSEELHAKSYITKHLRAARAMSSIIAIMDDYGDFVPVDRTGNYEVEDEQDSPVVFNRPFMLLRQ